MVVWCQELGTSPEVAGAAGTEQRPGKYASCRTQWEACVQTDLQGGVSPPKEDRAEHIPRLQGCRASSRRHLPNRLLQRRAPTIMAPAPRVN
jgi:hypothetical protein